MRTNKVTTGGGREKDEAGAKGKDEEERCTGEMIR
jgi:hypothetical protein